MTADGEDATYPAAEKPEIIRLVEQSASPVRRTLEKLGIPHATFYGWYDRYQTGGPEALDDRHPMPDRVWNRIPDDVRERIINLAPDELALSPRELAVRFTDVAVGGSVFRLLKARDLIDSPTHRHEGLRRVVTKSAGTRICRGNCRDGHSGMS